MISSIKIDYIDAGKPDKVIGSMTIFANGVVMEGRCFPLDIQLSEKLLSALKENWKEYGMPPHKAGLNPGSAG